MEHDKFDRIVGRILDGLAGIGILTAVLAVCAFAGWLK